MHDSVIPVDQYLNATSLNGMKHTSETIQSARPKTGQSIFRIKTREKGDKTPEISPVTLIRMEQLAPEGSTIVNNDGKYEALQTVFLYFQNFFVFHCIDIQPNSLKYILRQRQGRRQQESGLSDRVKRFYQNQDELIDGYERAEKQANNDQEEQEKNDILNKKTKKMINILSRASFAVNIVSSLMNSTIMILHVSDIISYQNRCCDIVQVTLDCLDCS
jgi:hypothetical protein